MATFPLVVAIIVGIIYGSVKSAKLAQEENPKKIVHPYLQSIIVTLVVYLIVSTIGNLK